ncbi:hypothetical protein AAULR_19256, partial [Lacticaseibacillus rhamnosus MTCC 5462]
MLFAAHLRDYEVVGQYTDKWGHRHDSSRVCHQMTKKEARDAMQRYLLQHYSDSVDLN